MSSNNVFIPLKTSEDIVQLIKDKKLYAIVEVIGPIKRYSRIIKHKQVDMDCVEFTLANGNVVESFVDEDIFDSGIYVKKTSLRSRNTSLAAGGGRTRRRKHRN
jgi:hypothetical protein